MDIVGMGISKRRRTVLVISDVREMECPEWVLISQNRQSPSPSPTN